MSPNNKELINHLLQAFKIDADCVDHAVRDNYSYYDLKLRHSGKVKDIQRYGDELSLALKSPSKPRVKILHNEGLVRLEFVTPRTKRLDLFDYFTNRALPKGQIICLLGQTVDGKRMWMDLAQNPHLLVAGTTGSGKTTLIHNIIVNIFNYNDVDLILVDPKGIEFSEYDGKFPNVQVIYTYADTLAMLKSMFDLMESRGGALRAGEPANNLKSIVIIIDEFADVILQDSSGDVFNTLCRLAQKCRAAKIHIILATQRPSVNIINGTIKANFPARISCRVSSQVDSKVVLDTGGAETLLGNGDAIVRDHLRQMERFQVAYTTAAEICSYFTMLLLYLLVSK